jgi:colicin import membrane protein
MIKFIFLLPLRIIGLLFMAIGAALDGVNRRRIEKAKQLEKQRREYERMARIQSARIEKEKREQDRRERIEQADRRRAEKEKAAADRKKAADLERKKALQFKATQARTDIVHYEIQRRELLKLYDELIKQFDAAGTDKQKEIVFRKQIALNNQMRGIDRKIEQAQFTINRTV